MYPRNAASPERIAIGAVVQISDGAVQGSGVTVTVRGQGGAEGAGGGTTAYGATGVIVYYTPLQAETDFTSFVVIASKTGCIPVSQTIITSASSVPGRTMPADGSITAAVIATGAIDADAIADNAIDAGAIAADAITAAKIANGAIDAATFAADVDAEILSYIVDDATRIDASALNTASVTTIPAILVDTGTTLDGKIDAILLDTGTDGVVVAAASKTGYRLSATGVDDILDEVVEGAVTLRQSSRLWNAAMGGIASGLATTNAKYRDLGDTKDRVDATVDADGNRSAVTLDLT